MKITIITGPFASIPPYSISAIEKRWYSCGQEFIKLGHQVNYICKRPNEEVVDTDLVTYIKGYDRSRNDLYDKTVREFWYAVRALNAMEECDILVLNSIYAPIIAPLFYKRKYKAAIYNVARMPKKQMALYSRMDMLSCVSSSVKEVLLEQCPYLEEKVCVISNPVNTEVFTFEKKRCSPTPNVVYSGRVHPEKGLDILCESIERLNKEGIQVGLTIVGPTKVEQGGGGKAYTDKLDAIAKSFRIEYVEAIKDPVMLATELRWHDIYCYPSVAERGETFGVAPLEAMTLGIPTVLSQLACFTDFAKDGYSACMFNHRSANRVDELCGQIRRLIEDEYFYEKISMNGAESAKNFSNEKIALRYLSLFKDLLNNKK